MNFKTATKTINDFLEKEQPKTFSSSWIFARSQSAYNFVRKNFRTENDHIDWDRFTESLKRKYLKRWLRYKRKQAKPYENPSEVEVILTKYRERLYVFIAPVDEGDRELRNKIIVALVRIAQRGNVLAQQELVKWMRYIVDDWTDKYYPLFKWRGYGEAIDEKIKSCIRCYKYTGSFPGYLFKTLEYSARGMRSLQAWSLDDPVGECGATKIDFVMQDTETGEVKLFGK